MTALEPVAKLSRDLRLASISLSKDEARFLVDAYYAMQTDRIRDRSQQRQLAENAEPASVLTYLGDQHAMLEKEIAKALDTYSASQPIGRWMRSITGVGPIIAAGLMAHIDIQRATTASAIWRFAGLDPTQKWEKKTKRPWNAALKLLCWKLGESFVKTHTNESSFYGPIYRDYKAKIERRNERGEYADQAKAILASKNIGKATDAYKHLSAGRLPPAQIHARARRYVVKLFLSHLHETWRRLEGLPVREPYMVEKGGAPHAKIPPPPLA